MPLFPMERVDEQVWAKVENLITNPATLWESVYGQESRAGRETLTQRRAELSRQLAHAKAQEERAARLYTLGTAPQTAEKQVREATARRRTLEQELGQAERAVQREKSSQNAKELAFQTLNDLRGKLGSLTREEKRRVLQVLVPGGLTHRVELQADGSVLVSVIVDLNTETQAMSMPYSEKCYLK